MHSLGREGCHRGRCVECGIWFLTKRCNRKQRSLSCPFGCRVSRAYRLSTERSRAYYQSPEGRKKKRELNRKRDRRKVEPKPVVKALSEYPSEGLIKHAVFVLKLARVKPCRDDVIEFLRESHVIWRQLSLACFEDCGYFNLRGEEIGRWPP